MEQQQVDGVEVRAIGPCAECGHAPSEAQLRDLVLDYKATADPCSICGKPIRLTSLEPKHLHGPDIPTEGKWDIQYLGYEKSFGWMSTGPGLTVDVRAHLACSILTMPFSDWDGKGVKSRSSGEPGVGNLEFDNPCSKCGALLEHSEKKALLSWLFNVFSSVCVYCGRRVEILWAKIEHHTWRDEDQCRRWGIDDYRREPFVDWCGHVSLPGGGLQSLLFRGHLDCARQRLPHALWDPPLPRKPWRKQDWSLRIEPWHKGHIPGEAVPDWGMAYKAVVRSQTAGKAT